MDNATRTAEARKLYNRINRRAQGLKQRGEATAALGKFEQVERLKRGEVASKSYLNTLRKLDKAPGLTARGAKAAVITETRKLARITSASYRLTASKAMLRASAILAKDVINARLGVARQHSTDQAYLERTRSLVDAIRPNVRTSQGALRAMASSAAKMLSYKSLSKEYAEKAFSNAVAIFGDEYETWSPEQRSAVWQAFSRTKESLGSFKSVEQLGVAARTDSVSFSEREDGSFLATIEASPEGARTEQARQAVKDEIGRRLVSRKEDPADVEDSFRKGRALVDMLRKSRRI